MFLFHYHLEPNLGRSQRAASVLTILMGTLLYTWVKSRETPPSHSKEPVLPMSNIPQTQSTSNLLPPNGDLSDEEQTLADGDEIFATGEHDFDEETKRKPLP